jgi:hypothetical protein
MTLETDAFRSCREKQLAELALNGLRFYLKEKLDVT